MEKFSKEDLIRIYNYTDHPFTNYSDWLEDLLLEQLNRIQDLQTKHLESLTKANAARQGHLFQGV